MLLKTGAAGFCHTDELIRTGGMPISLKGGLIGSHEPAGTVVALGESAAKAGWKIGQRVGALGYMGYCGTLIYQMGLGKSLNVERTSMNIHLGHRGMFRLQG